MNDTVDTNNGVIVSTRRVHVGNDDVADLVFATGDEAAYILAFGCSADRSANVETLLDKFTTYITGKGSE